MGIKLVMASIPNMEEVLKVPRIYKAALCCIFLNSLREYLNGALLKY